MITTASGLQYEDTTPGSGATAAAGQRVSVHYTGWLWQDGQQGRKFDSTKAEGTRACRVCKSAARAC